MWWPKQWICMRSGRAQISEGDRERAQFKVPLCVRLRIHEHCFRSLCPKLISQLAKNVPSMSLAGLFPKSWHGTLLGTTQQQCSGASSKANCTMSRSSCPTQWLRAFACSSYGVSPALRKSMPSQMRHHALHLYQTWATCRTCGDSAAGSA